MWRKIALNFGALLVGAVISLAFLEITLRIYNPIIQTVKGSSIVLRVNSDELRRNTSIPGVAPQSHIHQNSLGFRGADPPADFADRLTMIAVGGSTTRSVTQSDDRTWTALLGDAVADCFNRTWINNAGFDGHTSFAHVDLIQNYISRLHPKVVLMLIGTNELFVGPNAHFEVGIKHLLDELATRSEVVTLGLTLYRSFRAWRGGLNLAFLTEGDPMPPDGEARLAVARDLRSEYAERLRLIIRLLREAKTAPVLMTQPTLAGTGRDPTTGMDLSRLRNSQFLYQAMEIYNDTMQQVAQSEHVYLIDLARSMPKDTKYYFDPMHYTDAGAKKVAELAAMGLLPYLERKFPSFNKGSCQIGPTKPS
jgi:lysophospholipase L1-like esterase